MLAEIGKYDNSINHIQTAIVRLTKALTLCAGQKKQYYESELSKYIYRAKKLLWYKQQEIVNKQKREAILNYSKYIELRDNLSPEEKKVEVNNFISSIGDPDRPFNFEIPSYLICKITLVREFANVGTDGESSNNRCRDQLRKRRAGGGDREERANRPDHKTADQPRTVP